MTSGEFLKAKSFGDAPSTQEEAEKIDCKFFFTGDSCKNGHVTPRRTSNKECLGCYHDRLEAAIGDPVLAEYRAQWHLKHKDRIAATYKERYLKKYGSNGDRTPAQQKAYDKLLKKQAGNLKERYYQMYGYKGDRTPQQQEAYDIHLKSLREKYVNTRQKGDCDGTSNVNCND